MKRGVRSVIGAMVAMVMGGCASMQLNISELDDPTFELNEIRVMVNGVIDEERNSDRFMDAQLMNVVEAVESVAESEGARIDARRYVAAHEAGEIELRFTERVISEALTVHIYEWELAEEIDQRVDVSITIAPVEGQLPAYLYFVKTNPEKPERPRQEVIEFRLTVGSE